MKLIYAVIIMTLMCLSFTAKALTPDCVSAQTPIGALPPAIPIWCMQSGSNGAATFINTDNAWQDEFNHHLSQAPIGSGYRQFSFGKTKRQQHFRHANHWMQDLDLSNRGGVSLRPNSSFRFVNGKLVIEADLAAAINEYQDSLWGEITITTASQPTGERRDALYAYDYFPGHMTLGCRMQADRIVTCSLFDDSHRGLNEGGRIWEMSFFQLIGTDNSGGGPWGEGETAWRSCGSGKSDIQCRDRFRLELTETSLTLFVNGYRYFQQKGLPPLPAKLLNQPVFVYFSGVNTQIRDGVARFHWDSLSINQSVGNINPQPDPAHYCRLQKLDTTGAWITIQEPFNCP